MAGILDAAALAELQALKAQTMTGLATVEALTRTEGAGGNDTVAWAAKPGLAGLPVAWRFESPSEVPAADAVRAVSRVVLEFAVSNLAGTAGIDAEDRVQITHTVPGVSSPITVSVIGAQPKGADEVVRRVVGEQVGGGG